METNSKQLSTFWKATLSLIAIVAVSTCVFSPREPLTSSTAVRQELDKTKAYGLSSADKARAIVSEVTATSAAENQAVTLREFHGQRPDGGEYVAFERPQTETFPHTVTIFLLEPPLDHDAQVMMIYRSVREAYGLNLDIINNPFKLETKPTGVAFVLEDDRFTYTVFSVRTSDEDPRWGAVSVWRKPR